MIRAITIAALLLASLGLVGGAVPIFAQQSATKNVISVSGGVVSVDLTKQEVVIKQLKDKASNTYVNTTFAVEPTTKITKDNTTLALSDLKAGDKVKIELTVDETGKKKVESILVEMK